MIYCKFLKIHILMLTLIFSLHYSGFAFANSDCNRTAVGAGPQTVSSNYNKPNCWNISDQEDIEWDIEHSPPEDGWMDASQSITLAIVGKNAPETYKWSIEGGRGFSLENATGLTNTLTTAIDACGTVKITISGCNGANISEIVRCTNDSHWYPQGVLDLMPSTGWNYKETVYGGVMWTTYGLYTTANRIRCLPESPTPAPCNAEDLKTTCINAEDIYAPGYGFSSFFRKYCWGCNQ